MTPKETILQWVEVFNTGDARALAEFYAEDAINHQIPNKAVVGKQRIREMFEHEFAQAKMTCLIQNLFEDGEWAILEWKDPKGLRGCGFFHIQKGKIVMQRGYWDKMSFLRQHGLPVTG
jgi:limonene-1,2-epoxide hydrolase